jgi:hypothetical protein
LSIPLLPAFSFYISSVLAQSLLWLGIMNRRSDSNIHRA